MPKTAKNKLNNINCEICSKNQSQIFCQLKSRDIKQLSNVRKIFTYKKGESLFEEGTASPWLYCIHSGKVKLHKLNPEGKSRITRFVGAGEIIGQFESIGDSKHVSTATAIEETIACLIPKNYITSELKKSDLHLPLIKKLASDIKELERNMISYSDGSATEQVIRSLFHLKDKFGYTADGSTLDIYLTRKEFGEFLGITTETVIRVLKELQKKDLLLIEKKQIQLRDPAGLKKELF